MWSEPSPLPWSSAATPCLLGSSTKDTTTLLQYVIDLNHIRVTRTAWIMAIAGELRCADKGFTEAFQRNPYKHITMNETCAPFINQLNWLIGAVSGPVAHLWPWTHSHTHSLLRIWLSVTQCAQSDWLDMPLCESACSHQMIVRHMHLTCDAERYSNVVGKEYARRDSHKPTLEDTCPSITVQHGWTHLIPDPYLPRSLSWHHHHVIQHANRVLPAVMGATQLRHAGQPTARRRYSFTLPTLYTHHTETCNKTTTCTPSPTSTPAQKKVHTLPTFKYTASHLVTFVYHIYVLIRHIHVIMVHVHMYTHTHSTSCHVMSCHDKCKHTLGS